MSTHLIMYPLLKTTMRTSAKTRTTTTRTTRTKTMKLFSSTMRRGKRGVGSKIRERISKLFDLTKSKNCLTMTGKFTREKKKILRILYFFSISKMLVFLNYFRR